MTSGPYLRMAFAGDVCLGCGWQAQMKEHGAGHPFRFVKELLNDADLSVGNLECCFVDHASDDEMAVPASFAGGLLNSGFNALNLANNHILDCGFDGLEATERALNDVGIIHFGAGRDLTEASRPVIVERKGRRIALLGVCDASRYYAEMDRPGIAPLKTALLAETIRSIAADVQLIVVSVHADLEFSSVPSGWRQRFSRRLIRAGAHLVIGHHPHVLQGVEAYQHGVIAYSLGNFVFRVHGDGYQEEYSGVTDGAVLRVDVDFGDSGPVFDWRLIPVHIGEDELTRPLEGNSARRALLELERRSLWLKGGERRKRWNARCRREAMQRLFQIYYELRKSGMRAAWEEARRLLMSPEERRWMRSLVCFGYL